MKVAALAFRLLSAPLTLVSTAMGAMMEVIWGAGYWVGCVIVLSFGQQCDKKNEIPVMVWVSKVRYVVKGDKKAKSLAEWLLIFYITGA